MVILYFYLSSTRNTKAAKRFLCKEIGIEEGIVIGEGKGIEGVAHKLFKERKHIKFLEKLTGLSIEKLLKIKNNI